MPRLTASFDVTGWDQTPYEAPGTDASLARATVCKTFRGDLTGESVAEILLCQAVADDPGAGAGFVGSEVVTGTLDGREGTFVMQHGGVMGGAEPPYTFGTIIPGTGTGDLAGLAGTVEISRDADGHRITLDVTFG